MSDSLPVPASSPGYVSARYARELVEAAGARGADRLALLQDAGLTRETLDAPEARVPVAAMTALWEAAVEATDDAVLGLRVGNGFHLTSLSIVGYMMLSAETLGGGLGDLATYCSLAGLRQMIRLEVLDQEGSAFVEFECALPPDASLVAPRHHFEALASGLVASAYTLTGQRLPVRAVTFIHPPSSARPSVYKAFLGVVPTFGADRCRVVFGAEALGWRVRSASPVLHAAFTREASQMLGRLSASVRPRVEAAIAARLDGAVPLLADVAADLAMRERTLQRHLEDEGTTFQAVCDDVRRATALRLLAAGDQTLHEVAFRLGYSAPSAFHRAFKRWTGQTPAAYRAAATAADGGAA